MISCDWVKRVSVDTYFAEKILMQRIDLKNENKDDGTILPPLTDVLTFVAIGRVGVG
jgi:hypothetical protein